MDKNFRDVASYTNDDGMFVFDQFFIGFPSIEGVVEDTFIRQMYSGESLLPYRTAEPLLSLVW